MDECVDNSSKQRAECLCRYFIVVHTEHGEWQAFFIWEKLACLVEDSRLYTNVQSSMHKQCVPGSFLCPRTRPWDRLAWYLYQAAWNTRCQGMANTKYFKKRIRTVLVSPSPVMPSDHICSWK